MARQVLENGVILPAEYSDDWYDDMTSNLTKLDDVIGSDSEKLSSSDVGAAALSNNYNDLDNLPTIPTVNDATLTIQKNGVDVQTFTANASSNVTCNITVPTKTSDLTNDSNFVDTSNSAVSSGITSAKVTDYDTHIADTDIHVTTADKNRWNNQTYVFRYSSTALTASSTNSNALLDNTDNLKVGDKVIDSSGVLFSITAIDTQNSTFTIGTALIDLAQDSDVVHKSGNETIAGEKTFNNDVAVNNTSATVQADVPNLVFKNPLVERASTTLEGYQQIRFVDKNANNIGTICAQTYTSGRVSDIILTSYSEASDQSERTTGVVVRRTPTTSKILPYSDNITALGENNRRWSRVYGTEYYYGSNSVEFSTKFVTTDTNQTIAGVKTFSSNVNVYNHDSATDTANIILKNSKAERGSTTNTDEQNIFFLDKDNAQIGNIKCNVDSDGYSNLTLQCSDSNNVSLGVQVRKNPTGGVVRPTGDNQISLGQGGRRWYNTYTSKINGLEPSSLSLPSGRNTRIDISSYFTNLGSGDTNFYSVSANGYIYMQLKDITTVHCFDFESLSTTLAEYAQTFSRGTDGQLYVLFPVKKDHVFKSTWYTTTTVTISGAYFIPCQGNV